MMGHWFFGFGWAGLIIHIILSITLTIALVILVVWLVGQLSGNNSGRSSNKTASSAIKIVKERYAKGEITREEYQSILSDLL